MTHYIDVQAAESEAVSNGDGFMESFQELQREIEDKQSRKR